MRNRVTMATLLAGGLLLTACGGGGGSTSESGMTPGVEYAVAANDRLVSTSPEPAVIKVRHDLATDIRYVTLLEGGAELLQAEFVVQ